MKGAGDSGETDSPDKDPSDSRGSGTLHRRDFLRRAIGAGLAASGVVGLMIHRHRGHEEESVIVGGVPDSPGAESKIGPISAAADGEPYRNPPSTPFDYRLWDTGPVLGIVEGEDRARTVRRAVEALGGMGRFVRKGERVLVKPNIGFATPPEQGATTHPDTVREVIRLCLAAGAAEVLVTDYPTTDPDHAFRITGIGKAAEEAGARVILPREGQFRRTTLAGSDLFRDWPMLMGPFEGVHRVIGVAPVKDHGLSGATLGIKNWYGLIGGRRALFHQRISDCLVDLATLVRPTLILLDGIVSMVSNGPTGGSPRDLRQTNTVIVGTDPVAVDACGASLLRRSTHDLPWLKQAERSGLGTTDWEGLHPVRDRLG